VIARVWTMFMARNREFLRDRGSMAWTFLFPFLVLLGFYFINGEERDLYKVGWVGEASGAPKWRLVERVEFETRESGMDKLRHHKIDLLIEPGSSKSRYWISTTSPKSYIVERLLWSESLEGPPPTLERQTIEGREIRYIDWLFPGLLGMNIMFNALFGVGYVLVRYRKKGILRRLSVTPLTAFEFLTAQLLSRLTILLGTVSILFFGCQLIFGFTVEGSYFVLLLALILGATALSSIGLVVASRTQSDELAGGLLNLMTWPMMFLSEVWFSLEGSPDWVRSLSNFMPLTHFVRVFRGVMNEGMTLAAASHSLIILLCITLVALSIGAAMFRWQET
jgi:ABC-2 type transport system permease protein